MQNELNIQFRGAVTGVHAPGRKREGNENDMQEDEKEEAGRRLFSGDWKCGMCGKAITSLPFEPNPMRLPDLRCWECYKKARDGEGDRE